MKTIVFDIETGALPEGELAALLPPFDPAEVKCGNIKDPEKIAARISEAEGNHRRDFFEKAALDPLTGRVLAIGLLEIECGEFRVIGQEDEGALLSEFWQACRGAMGTMNLMVGFNSYQFDLPFLIRRSWKHRIAVPLGIRRGRYWGHEMIDVRDEWQLGDRMARGSLDSIAKHMGVGTKSGDGSAFAELWRTDREKAVAYLRNDLELTAKVALGLGLVGDVGSKMGDGRWKLGSEVLN